MAQARDVRRQNMAVEVANRVGQEQAFARLESENIRLSNEFIIFNLDNLSNSPLKTYDDETLLDDWCRLQQAVRDFFRNILSPANYSGVVGSDTFGREATGQRQLDHLNQIADVGELSELLRRAKALHMDEISIYFQPPFSLFDRLNNIIQIRGNVIAAHDFCKSSIVKKTLWTVASFVPGVQKGDSYKLLEESISKCISTGLFLRKYRDDCTFVFCQANSIAEDPRNGKKQGDIIDFRVQAQREDYFNLECSEFVEPALRLAERCLQEKRRAEQAEDQAKSEKRLIDARQGGKISRRQKLGRRNSKNRK